MAQIKKKNEVNYFIENINPHKVYKQLFLNQGCNFTWKPGKTLKNLEFNNLGKNNLENLEFEKFCKKPGKTWIF